jgi:hypothetical protein
MFLVLFGRNESNISPQLSTEWPSDWFVEAPRAIHQDWHIDLNMDCSYQREERQAIGLNQDNMYVGEDIVHESHCSDESGSDCEEEIVWQQEEDKPVEELFPVPDEEDMDEVPLEEKAAIARAKRSKVAKANATKAREAKLRATEGTIEDVFVLSDSCSEDNKDLINSSDDDGAVLESEIAIKKQKSKAKPLKKRVYYDEMKDNAHEQFQLDLCFHSVTQLRKALENYHIAYIRNFEYLKNNQERVIVCCSSKGKCSFMIYSSQIQGESTHCIRQIKLPHTCGTTTDTSRINSTWIAKKYEDLIRSDPALNITAIMDAVMKEHGIEISKHMAYRAKNKALEAIEGHADRQYLRIKDYLQTVMDKNNGSRCHLATIRPLQKANEPKRNPRFHGLFFALHAQIEGFKNGCRPFFGKNKTSLL